MSTQNTVAEKTEFFTANEIRRYAYNGTNATFNICDTLEKDGFSFIPGNNPFMKLAKKWENYELVRVAQTNSRTHGRCVQTLWAVKHNG